MTYARSEIVAPEEVGVYHCVSRCVRRAFLCGRDAHTAKSFEHRREWIRARLSTLAEVFAVEVAAYAVMSNHLHTLLRIRPDVAKKWSAKEVAYRWRTLFPLRRGIGGKPEEPSKEEIQAIAGNPDMVELYRERLSSLSWFNRCLNENIARRANREDKCTGRFWEGRFKCQRVYDVAGVLACSAYIDLNPVRAGMAKSLEGSDHTSVQDRIFELRKSSPQRHQKWSKVPLVALEDITEQSFTVEEYIKLVESTGKVMKEGKGSLPADAAVMLSKLEIAPEHWMETAKDFNRRFYRVAGPAAALERAAARAGKAWFHGLGAAKRIFGAGLRSAVSA